LDTLKIKKMKRIAFFSLPVIMALFVHFIMPFSFSNLIKLPVMLKSGDLVAAFVDNRAYGDAHKARYNGISELRHKDQDSTLFVPFYAGFNLEHVWGGDVLDPQFEPREYPMHLKKLSKYKVSLHQDELPLSHIESTTTFTMVPPHYIDVSFTYIIHDDTFFKHGYAGLFWASYINAPADKNIYFQGRKKCKEGYHCVKAFSTKHGLKSGHLQDGDTYEMYAEPDFNVTLASHYSEYVYKEPYYFGRFHNMAFAYLFSVPEDQILRFAQSPTGGGDANPAWDFYILNPDFETGKKYTFSVRLVYKPFISNEDIRKEYKKWKGEE